MDPMREELLAFPCQFAKGIAKAGTVRAPKAKRILFAGMGGSTLAADLLTTYLPQLPISVHKDYGVPAWVDASTLVFAASYSGNTEETISSFQAALKKKTKVVALTNGGKLAQMAEKAGKPVVFIPNTVQPRCATGYMFSSAVAVLENAGIVKGKGCELVRLGDWLGRKNAALEQEGMALGKKVAKSIPVIYASSKWWALARTWKIKFNENAKIPSFWNVFPELNHNEMVGFTDPRAKFSFIFLEDGEDNPRVKKRMAIMKGLMEKKGLPVHEVQMAGSTVLEKMFSTLLLSDWVSYCAALENGTDPAPVRMVEDFKKKMG